MSNRKSAADSTAARNDDPFAAFFENAGDSERYGLEIAKIEFTEEILARMKTLEINRAELARRMKVKAGFVTRLLSGGNNFELGTMVKLAKALECDFRCHLQAHGTETRWMDFLTNEPVRSTAAGSPGGKSRKAASGQKETPRGRGREIIRAKRKRSAGAGARK